MVLSFPFIFLRFPFVVLSFLLIIHSFPFIFYCPFMFWIFLSLPFFVFHFFSFSSVFLSLPFTSFHFFHFPLISFHVSFMFLSFPSVFLSFTSVSFHVFSFDFNFLSCFFNFLTFSYVFLFPFVFLQFPFVFFMSFIFFCFPSFSFIFFRFSSISFIFLTFYFHFLSFSFYFFSCSFNFLSFPFISFNFLQFPWISSRFHVIVLSFYLRFAFISSHFLSFPFNVRSFHFISLHFHAFPFNSCHGFHFLSCPRIFIHFHLGREEWRRRVEEKGMIRGFDYEVFSPTSRNIRRHNLRKTLKTPMSPMFSDLTLFNLHFLPWGGLVLETIFVFEFSLLFSLFVMFFCSFSWILFFLTRFWWFSIALHGFPGFQAPRATKQTKKKKKVNLGMKKHDETSWDIIWEKLRKHPCPQCFQTWLCSTYIFYLGRATIGFVFVLLIFHFYLLIVFIFFRFFQLDYVSSFFLARFWWFSVALYGFPGFQMPRATKNKKNTKKWNCEWRSMMKRHEMSWRAAFPGIFRRARNPR